MARRFAPSLAGAALAVLALGSCVGPRAVCARGDGAECLARAEVPSDAAAHEHLLRRLTFGPRPGDAAHLATLGVARWLEEQLAPERIEDRAAYVALAPYRDALRAPDELWSTHDDDPNAVPPMMLPAQGLEGPMAVEATPARASRNMQRDRLEGALMMSALARQLTSRRQVLEVMTDLFVNHFNVYARKGHVRYLAGDLVERAVRPHALGSFPAMLEAVARHPAMLLYLDNARSVAPRPSVAGRPGRGLNENYARELLELHTLGADAGYAQSDVREVARALTGWGVSNPSETGALVFEFRAGMHDRGAKRVAFLGLTLAEGGGEEEGLRVLRALAMHPRTAHTVARKMAQRFVADEPPEALVSDLAQAYLRTGGSIAAMLRVLVAHPLFWAAEYRGSKVKTPLEFVLSSLRALDATTDGTDGLARTLMRMGHAPYMNPVPTGYSDDARRLGGAPLVERLNFAMDLADGTLNGVTLQLDALFPPDRDAQRTAERAVSLVLAGGAPAAVTRTLATAAQGLDGPQSRRVALALALASPGFQHQ